MTTAAPPIAVALARLAIFMALGLFSHCCTPRGKRHRGVIATIVSSIVASPLDRPS
jgi:hypothetical protein